MGIFPRIEKISDCEKAISGHDEIKIFKKNGYKLICYSFQEKNTFVDYATKETMELAKIRRECRGISFDNEGNIIARKYHKFFNVNENEESQLNRINVTNPHIVLEKLDGSMITPVLVNGKIEWHTKKGYTDFSENVSTFVESHKNYISFAEFCYNNNLTPIFEYCSLNNKIVIKYQKERLVLTAIRNLYTGDYIKYDDMDSYAEKYDIDVVKAYGQIKNLEMFINENFSKKGIEGFVIRFDNGEMYKIKTEEYIELHKLADEFSQEKNVWKLVVSNKLDDFLGKVDIDLQNDLLSFQVKLNESITKLENQASNIATSNKEKTRKEFALEVIPKFDKRISSILWDAYDGKDLSRFIRDFILKYCNSNNKIELIRDLFGDMKWLRYNTENLE